MLKILQLPIYIFALLLLAAVAADASCARVDITGDSCGNLAVNFDLEKCGENFKPTAPVVKCSGTNATASIETKKFVFTAKLKKYTGKLNNSIWDLTSEVTQSSKSPKKETKQEASSPAQAPSQAQSNIQAAPPEPNPTPAVPVPAPPPAQSQNPAPTQAPALAPTPSTTSTTTPPASLSTAVATAVPSSAKSVDQILYPLFKPSVLLQYWYVDESHPATTASDSNFRLRRAEVKFSGAANDYSRWFVSADFAKSLSTTSTSVVTSTSPTTTTTTVAGINTSGDNKLIQDAGIAFKVAPEVEISIGQFKVLTASESLQSSSELLFAERSLLARTYGERRDPGTMAVYKTKSFKAAVMVSNGRGANLDDNNNSKDTSSRLDYTWESGVSAGAFAFAKDNTFVDLDRYGINLGYSAGNYLFKTELINAKNGTTLRSSAVVADAAYKWNDSLQLAARYEYLQPDTTNEFRYSAAVTGVNYFISKHNLKLQLNHSHLFNMNGANGSYSTGADKIGSVITFAVQSNF